MTVLQPPYIVDQRDGRVLIVPGHVGPSDQRPPFHPIAEVRPYDARTDPVELAEAIAARLNWHDQLTECLGLLLREFAPPKLGATYSAAQRAAILEACELLNTVAGK